MPVDFLSDDQVAVSGRFSGPVSRAELKRFFFLDDRDLELVGRRRGEDSRLGSGCRWKHYGFWGRFLMIRWRCRNRLLISSGSANDMICIPS